MKTQFSHSSIFVKDVERSVRFYHEALDLRKLREKFVPDRQLTLTFLGGGDGIERIELMHIPDMEIDGASFHSEYSHLAFCVDDDAVARARHEEMGCVCLVNERAGLYYISDPDGYWIEILPPDRWQD